MCMHVMPLWKDMEYYVRNGTPGMWAKWGALKSATDGRWGGGGGGARGAMKGPNGSQPPPLTPSGKELEFIIFLNRIDL